MCMIFFDCMCMFSPLFVCVCVCVNEYFSMRRMKCIRLLFGIVQLLNSEREEKEDSAGKNHEVFTLIVQITIDTRSNKIQTQISLTDFQH